MTESMSDRIIDSVSDFSDEPLHPWDAERARERRRLYKEAKRHLTAALRTVVRIERLLPNGGKLQLPLRGRWESEVTLALTMALDAFVRREFTAENDWTPLGVKPPDKEGKQ